VAKKLKLDINDSTCLHCVWVDALRAKHPKYKGGKDGKDAKAWEDMVHSAIVIAGRIFSMMKKEEQIEFFRHIVQASTVNGMRDRVMKGMFGSIMGMPDDGAIPMTVDELKAFLESLGQPKN
jgi:rRNA processing protein Krr1/Pno1